MADRLTLAEWLDGQAEVDSGVVLTGQALADHFVRFRGVIAIPCACGGDACQGWAWSDAPHQPLPPAAPAVVEAPDVDPAVEAVAERIEALGIIAAGYDHHHPERLISARQRILDLATELVTLVRSADA